MLIKIADVKEYLKINDNNKDNLLINLIEYAGKFITNYCNQNIETENHTIDVSGNGLNLLLLPAYFPITALTKIEYRNTLADAFAELTLSDYSLIKIDNVDYVYSQNTFNAGISNYRITFTSGYASTEIPDDVKQVCIELVSIALKESDAGNGIKSGRLGLSSITESSNGLNINTALLTEIKKHYQILNHYKRIVI